MHDVPMELVEDDTSQQEYEAAKEEGYYFGVLYDFIQIVDKYGYKKVLADMEDMLARHWRL